MKENTAEICFKQRKEFRIWLSKNAETSSGIWLVFGKDKTLVTLSANDALEEALCFGWIDGKIKSIDETKYIKYFTRRREKSAWSEKNKKVIEILRDKKLMTAMGEQAVDAGIKNGTWNAKVREKVSDQQVEEFTVKLSGLSQAYGNFCKMPPSTQKTYVRRFFSFKSEEARERDFGRIVDRLNNNLKPM